MTNTLTRGFEVSRFYLDNNEPANNVRTVILYAVRPDGIVFRSNEHKDDSHFDRAGRTWTMVAELPPNAEFIGNYPPIKV